MSHKKGNPFAHLDPEQLPGGKLSLREIVESANAQNPAEAIRRAKLGLPPQADSKQAKRAARGRTSQEQGQDLETWIVNQFRALRMDERACLIRNQPIMRLVDKQQMLYRLGHKGHVDFSFVLRGGRHGDFDTKSTTLETWRLDDKLRHKRPKGHQGRKLCRSAQMGAIAGVFLRRIFPDKASQDYFVPWGPAGPLDQGKRFTLHFDDDLAPFALPGGKTWLDAATQWDSYRDQGWAREQKAGRQASRQAGHPSALPWEGDCDKEEEP